MKHAATLLRTTLAIAALTAFIAPTRAADAAHSAHGKGKEYAHDHAHDHGPGHKEAGDEARYGGVVAEVRGVTLELLAAPASLTLYVSDHGKPLSTHGGRAHLAWKTADGQRHKVELKPGDGQFNAQGQFSVPPGTAVSALVVLEGKPSFTAQFKAAAIAAGKK